MQIRGKEPCAELIRRQALRGSFSARNRQQRKAVAEVTEPDAPSPYGALPTTTTTRTTTTAADSAVGSSFALNMEVVIGDLVGFVFNNIYTSTALQGRQWKIFQQGKIEGLITFCTELQITKNPAGARFRQSPAAGNRKAHCIMSTLKVYVFRAERAISARILTYLDRKSVV